MEQIIKLIAGLVILFIALSGVDISFRPLKISLDNPVFGIGAIIMLIGFSICIGASQWRAVEDHREKTGYNKGYENGAEAAFRLMKEKSQKIVENEEVQN